MIIKQFDLGKQLDQKNYFLFYGENKGQKDELINKFFKSKFEKNIHKYSETDILKNIDILYENILTDSFFEKEKLIIIDYCTDKIIYEIKKITEKNIGNNKIILKSNLLEKKSKLRNFFEKEKELICIAFYPDNIQTLLSFTNDFFKKRNISLSFETINLIVNKANGERKFLVNELEKIELFLKNKKIISNNEINKLINTNEDNDVGELIDNCLAKNKKKIIFLMNENNFNSDDLIMIIRIFLSKAKRLLGLVKNFSLQKNIDKTILEAKPPIFWKEKEIVKKQIKSWSINQVENLILEINEIEFLVKTNSQNSKHILSDFILNKSS